MAGFKIKRCGKVKGSSLIEVVVSMLIIVIVFSIAMSIYTNVLRMSSSLSQHRAYSTLNDLLSKTEFSSELVDETFTVNSFKINKQVSLYDNKPGLKEIHLIAFNFRNEKLAEIRKVVYAPR